MPILRPLLGRVALLSTLALPPFAFAHAKPKDMSPAPNSVVAAPVEVSVIFTEPVEPKFSSLQLTDEKGKVLSEAATVADPSNHAHLTLALPNLQPGTYFVHWVTAAVDGHRMDGDYSFTVK